MSVPAAIAHVAGRLARVVTAPLDALSPPVRRIVQIEIAVAVTLSAFNSLAPPFTGLVLRRDLHATPLQLALTSSAGAALMLQSMWCTRRIHGRSPLAFVVWPGFVARGLFVLAPFIHSAWPLVGILVAGSLASAIAQPAYTAVAEAVYPREERGRALGIIRMMGSMLPIGLAPVAGHLVDSLGYRIVFPIAAVLGMGASLCQRRIGPTPPADLGRVDPSALRMLPSLLREDPAFRTLLVASSLFGLGVWLQQPVNPLMWVDVLHASAIQVGVAGAAASVAGLFVSVYWGRVLDRQSSLRTVRTVYALGMLTPLTYLAAFVVRTPWALVLSQANDAVALTGVDMVVIMAMMDLGRGRGATYQAVYLTVAGVRGIVAPLCAAVAAQSLGIAPVYAVTAALMLAAVWVAARLTAEPRVRERFQVWGRAGGG